MQDFTFYLKLGWEHIISWDALDHILFVLALSAIYLLSNWKQVLVLVTAFTIGHSLTLALSVYKIVTVNDNWVEFLIPCTIVATAVFNFLQKDFTPKSLRLNYFLALFFGLIHGLGFANYIRYMMAKDQSMGWSLFAFNFGLELGQVVVVLCILMLSFLVVNTLKLRRSWWVWGLSAIAFCIALNMVVERWIF
ncbi:HupE/UreJ family protein [Ferruginibacter sp. SUN106]|uniref:HupE/UreJ family protein n=1 Tax=Ferruginibacter sp. SUN106 TaxID=2978348 RepID=UPI003D36ACD6